MRQRVRGVLGGTAQVLDNMEIEQERGITIKAQTVRLNWQGYTLNLMDTPGHVDFAYEVSRSLAACEGSILVVDASQGVEAQTLANVYQAIDNNHEIVPVLNKIDLPAAEPDRVREQIEDVIGIDASDAVLCSAKSGIGIEDVLEAIVTRLPAPQGDRDAPLKAMLVDSWYDSYLGVVVMVRIMDGVMKKGMKVRMMATGANYALDRVGVLGMSIGGPSGLAAASKDPHIVAVYNLDGGLFGPVTAIHLAVAAGGRGVKAGDIEHLPPPDRSDGCGFALLCNAGHAHP